MTKHQKKGCLAKPDGDTHPQGEDKQEKPNNKPTVLGKRKSNYNKKQQELTPDRIKETEETIKD